MATKVNKDWLKDEYYDHSRKGSLYTNHPGMKMLKKFSKSSSSILDLGCGEGTRLNLLCKGKKCLGIDISPKAISLAKKAHPNLVFKKASLKKLPIKSDTFDLVYSAFVLEHIQKPKKVINEAIRVTKKGGHLVFLAPNYGAPNRCSPPHRGSRIQKIVYGFIEDLKTNKVGLRWRSVKPLKTKGKFIPDWDTVTEPYMGSLVSFLDKRGLKKMYANSCWSEEMEGANFYQRFFRVLSSWGIYPFIYWGPHIAVVYKK